MNQCIQSNLSSVMTKFILSGIKKDKLSAVEILQRAKSSIFSIEGLPVKSNSAQSDELAVYIQHLFSTTSLNPIPSTEKIYQILYNDVVEELDEKQDIKQVEGDYVDYFSKKGFLDLYKNAELVGINAKSKFLNTIVRLAIFNPNTSELVINNNLLNRNLFAYQETLFNNIITYLKEINPNYDTASLKLEDFPKLQSELFKLLFANVDGTTILSRSKSGSIKNKKFIEAFNSFNILTHFDSLLSDTFGKNIEINSNFKNSYNLNPNLLKYKFSGGSNIQSHWRTSDDVDIEKETANIVKILVSSIPVYKVNGDIIPDTYLTFNQYTHVICQLRNLPKHIKNLNIPNKVSNNYINYLNENNIKTIGDLLSHARVGKPTIDFKILYEAILHLYNNGYNISEKNYIRSIKGLNNIDMNYIQSIYNYVFKNNNNNTHSLYSKFINYTGINNFYEYIIANMLTVSPTNFIQYKRVDGKATTIKNMYLDSSTKSEKFLENYLLSKYNPKMPNKIYWRDIKNRFNIQYSNGKITFQVSDFTVEYNPKTNNFKYTGTFTGSTFKELDYITDFGDIYNTYNSITDNTIESFIKFYSELISNIYFNNEYESLLTDEDKKSSNKTKELYELAAGKYYAENKIPTYLDQFRQYNIISANIYGIYSNIAKAYSITKGLATKSTVSDSEGNQLGINGMSRLYEGFDAQKKQIKDSEKSAFKNLAIIQSDLAEEYLVAREIHKGKKLVNMTPNESFFTSFVIDFLKKPDEEDTMLFYPYVIADKSVIMKAKVSKSNLDLILKNIYSTNSDYIKWYNSLPLEEQQSATVDDYIKKFKISKIDLLHYAIKSDLGQVYENILQASNSKWKTLIEFIQQRTGTTLSFNALHDFQGFEKFYNDVKTKITGIDSHREFLHYWISEYQKVNPNSDLVFREEIEYCVIDGKLRTNRSLIAKLHRFKPNSTLLPNDLSIYTGYVFYSDYDSFVKDKEEKLLQDLLKNRFSADIHLHEKYKGISELKKSGWVGQDDKIILAKATKNGKDFINIRNIKDFNRIKSEGYSIKLHPVLEEYNWTDYFVSQEVMFTHMGIPEINPAKASTKLYDKHLHERDEESERNTAQTKRNVTESASMNLYTPGLFKGLPTELNCACIEDMSADVFNFTGDKGKANIWDGSIWVDGAYWYLQNHSLGASAAGPTQKSIWHYLDPETGAVTIVKSACPTIDNYACRNSMHNRNMIQKMRSSIQWDRPYNLLSQLKELKIYYKNENGQYVQRFVTDYRVNEEGNAEYIYNEVLVDQNGETIKESDVDFKIAVKNNWDLFNLLGGFTAVSFDADNKLSQAPKNNDISNKQLADLMCTEINGKQPLKNLGISYLISRSAIKKGIGNTNLTSTYNDDSSLTYLKLKLGYFGIQLDKTHEAEDSHLNILTQVTNALASRGYTGMQSQEMYAALRSATEDAMTPFIDEYAQLLGITHKGKIADLIAKKLAYQNSHSEGDILHSIVNDLITLSLQGIDLSTENINLPISLPATYKKLISVVSSTLNKLAIRLKFDGILAVLTPSHDIYKIFNGKQLGDFNSLTELIEEEANASTIPIHKLIPGTKYKRYIKGVFNGYADISDPSKYWEEQENYTSLLKEGNNVSYKEALYDELDYKLNNKVTPIGRNLEPYNVFFTDGKGHTFSMWDLVSVRNMWEAKTPELRKQYRKVFQEDLLRIQNKMPVVVSLYQDVEVNDKVLNESIITPVHIEVKPYENIMSNRLCKEYGITPSTKLYDITEDFFFINLVNNYTTKVDSKHFDVEIKQNNGDHIYLIQANSSTSFEGLNEDYTASTLVDSKGRIWLTDINGNETHELSSLNDKVYLDGEGNRIIYTNNLSFYSNLFYKNIQLISPKYLEKTSVLDIDPIWGQMNDEFKSKFTGAYDINFEKLLKDFEQHKQVGDKLEKKLRKQAKQQYNSFQMSLNTLVARIPSQSMQSVMPMRTIAFDETGINNVSVSIWQIWLQGSKLTIFK